MTTKDLAARIMGMTGGNTSAIRKATSAIDKAIAAAVQAEREACADMALMSNDTRANLASAIRSRSGGTK